MSSRQSGRVKESVNYVGQLFVRKDNNESTQKKVKKANKKSKAKILHEKNDNIKSDEENNISFQKKEKEVKKANKKTKGKIKIVSKENIESPQKKEVKKGNKKKEVLKNKKTIKLHERDNNVPENQTKKTKISQDIMNEISVLLENNDSMIDSNDSTILTDVEENRSLKLKNNKNQKKGEKEGFQQVEKEVNKEIDLKLNTEQVEKKVNKEIDLKVNTVINLLEQQKEFTKVLKQKDEAYEKLFSKYNQLREVKTSIPEKMLEEVTQNQDRIKKACDNLVNHYKKKAEEMTEKVSQLEGNKNIVNENEDNQDIKKIKINEIEQENQELLKKIKTLEAQNAQKQSNDEESQSTTDIKILQRIIQTYELMTAMRLMSGEEDELGLFHCKCVSRVNQSILEFDLQIEGQDIEYRPKTIKCDQFPKFLEDSIFFDPSETPLFTKKILDSVYSRKKKENSNSNDSNDN